MPKKRQSNGRKTGGRRPVALVIDPDSGQPVDNLRHHKPTGRYYRIEDDRKTRFYYPKRGLQNLAYLRRAIFEHRCHLDGKDPDQIASLEITRKHPTYDHFGTEVSAYQPETHINLKDVARIVHEQLTNPETRSDFAALVGIPELAYLERLRPTEASATLDSLLASYLKDKSGKTKREAKTYWDEFVGLIKVDKVSEITPDHIRKYSDAVHHPQKSRSYVVNRFAVIRAVFRDAQRNHIDSENIARVIQYLQILRPPKKKNGVNLHTVSPEDFQTLLEKSDARMKAILLLSLNAALQPVDLIRIRKDAIDWKTGEMRDIRTKTGIPRIAILWKRTRDALTTYLKETNHNHDEIFVGDTGEPMKLANQVMKRFDKLRNAAEISESVKFAHIRKSAETAAIEGGADSLHVDMLLGHRAAGVKDHYLLRKPKMVADACKAIEAHYFPKKKRGKK